MAAWQADFRLAAIAQGHIKVDRRIQLGIGTGIGALQPRLDAGQCRRVVESDSQTVCRHTGVEHFQPVGKESDLLVAIIDPAIDQHRRAAFQLVA